MNTTQPIRHLDTIYRIQDYLQTNASPRDAFLFTFLINTGMRIGDALPLRVRDVKPDEVIITEQKTNKVNTFYLEHIRPEINNYIRFKEDDDYLFPSNKGGFLSRTTAFRILDKAGDKFGIQLSSHTLRKSYGYHYFQREKNVTYLQKIFNHARPSITEKYICIEKDEIRKTQVGFKVTK
ncbi:tyrosine-type recombinase/integrase [Carnobacterium sp. PL24RED07]|uniref:tyrosine-type recombinase/integrase n=1 Tax=unclassified Carnobacterium TaxID=257487 RepID=UPI0011F06B7D|nr:MULTISPECIES: tyrosine-type recombinase/integrase [unclassified Carnobacterium]KAF3303632.1 tyrosine-type recombinase/integrase [Carnobacterium sp. PL26RED25]KAF3307150.1 tyrosine-type recombinase/integrase [Carnobacterium sp. PL24RED07]